MRSRLIAAIVVGALGLGGLFAPVAAASSKPKVAAVYLAKTGHACAAAHVRRLEHKRMFCVAKSLSPRSASVMSAAVLAPAPSGNSGTTSTTVAPTTSTTVAPPAVVGTTAPFSAPAASAPSGSLVCGDGQTAEYFGTGPTNAYGAQQGPSYWACATALETRANCIGDFEWTFVADSGPAGKQEDCFPLTPGDVYPIARATQADIDAAGLSGHYVPGTVAP